MFDIITFGSATSDSFLRLGKDNYQILTKQFLNEPRSVCFPLGAKVFLEDVLVASGGGGTNTACTFARQGLKVGYCGKVGKDDQGRVVLQDLKRNNVDVQFCQVDSLHPTAFSAVLSVPGQERTVLIQRGACNFMSISDVPLAKFKKVKWFYIAPLSGQSVQVFEPLIQFAIATKIKVAVNPGDTQINLGEGKINPLLRQVDILFLNREEGSLLSKIPMSNEIGIIKKLKSIVAKGLVVLTKGSDGSMVYDGQNLFQAGIPQTPLIEKTGAGDAYAGAFLSGLLEKNDVEYAMKLATANAAGCIQQVGAKNGLLKRGDWGPWPQVEVKRTIL